MLVSTSTSGAGSSDHQLNAIQSTSAFPASLFSDFLFLFAATKGQMGNQHDSLFTVKPKHGTRVSNELLNGHESQMSMK